MNKDRKEGIRGMANPGRYGIERVAYWLMRITGLGLLFYFIGHIYAVSYTHLTLPTKRIV